MSNQQVARYNLGDGIGFSSIRDEKFRHNGITINLIAPLSADTASVNAILPFIMRKSSGSYPDFTKLERHLCELYGASLSSDVIKYGNHHVLSFSILFIDDQITLDKEVISDKCADMLADMVLNPYLVNGAFETDDFELEKQNLIDTIESEINEKRRYAINQCRRMMFDGTSFALGKYGTVDQAKALTPQMAVDQYYKLIDTAKIEISFIGCGDSTKAMEKFREIFGKLDRHYMPITQEKIVVTPRNILEKTEEMDITQGKLVLGFRTPEIITDHQARTASLMTALYGGTSSSKLFLNVREKLSLCYYCAASGDRTTRAMIVDIGVESENKEKAQTAILNELEEMKKGNYTTEEIKETKLAIVNSLRGISDSISTMDSWFLVKILLGIETTPEEEIAGIEAVTPQDVQDFSRGINLDSIFFLTGKEDHNNG